MNRNNPPPQRAARLLASALLASAVGLGTLASASAQTLPLDPSRQPPAGARPAGPGAAPIRLPARAITLEQALAAAEVVAGRARGATIAQALAAPQSILGQPTPAALDTATVMGGGVTATFIASAQILAVIGTAAGNTLTVRLDAA